MPAQDTSKIKEKILEILRRRGPCLPVHISSEINMSILFTSAFLSELVSEKKIRMSYMKVGSSPIYLITGQENILEKFASYLKSKERDAFELLKKNKFLVDFQQEPAIRVALRAIKDFAIPFEEKDKLIWKYYTEKSSGIRLAAPIVHSKPQIKKEEILEKKEEKNLDIFEKEKKAQKEISKKTTSKKTTRKTSAYDKKNERFFNKVKEFLDKKEIKISDIEGFSKSDLILKVVDGGTEKILVAYNKKRIGETEILNAYKKASEKELPYMILSLGEPSKKLMNFVRAIRNLSKIYKIT